jgi:hypothetical protein
MDNDTFHKVLINYKFSAPEWVPNWVYIKIAHKFDSLLKDTVYNVYECGCFLIHKTDIRRKNRLKQFTINKKRVNHIICECKHKGYFLCKVKICSGCDLIMISFKQKEGMCKICNVENRTITPLFFRYDKIFEDIPENPTYTEPDCKHRGKCLDKIIQFDPTEFNVLLWCYKCPKFEDISDI